MCRLLEPPSSPSPLKMFFHLHHKCLLPKRPPRVGAAPEQMHLIFLFSRGMHLLPRRAATRPLPKVPIQNSSSVPAISLVHPYLNQIDSLLIMTVNPGFGGQSFIYETLPKIQQAREWREARNLRFRIGVDGGVDFKTAADCAHAGADTFISGTTLFQRRNLAAAVKKMRNVAAGAARLNRAEVLTTDGHR